MKNEQKRGELWFVVCFLPPVTRIKSELTALKNTSSNDSLWLDGGQGVAMGLLHTHHGDDVVSGSS
jgi:hypothetical protein